jgi:outer membrane lipoprotein-sorting protein
MSRTLLACTLLLAVGFQSAQADDKAPIPAPAASKSAGLERMKTLVGTWLKVDENGKTTDEVASVIKLTAGGSAVVETLFPGQPMEMVSVYTADGSDLVMTHYCVLGNQPRMKADPKSPEGTIKFDFTGGSNLDVAKDRHMHAATLKFVDADKIEIEGTGWENGAPQKECCGKLTLVRKK